MNSKMQKIIVRAYFQTHTNKLKNLKVIIMANGPTTIIFMEKANFFLKTVLITKEHLSKVLPKEKDAIYLIMGVFMKGKLKIMRQMEKEFMMILFKAIAMKDFGLMMSLKERARKSLQMVHIMKANFMMVLSMVMDIMYVTQEFIRDNL
jgi:hypothetical protein